MRSVTTHSNTIRRETTVKTAEGVINTAEKIAQQRMMFVVPVKNRDIGPSCAYHPNIGPKRTATKEHLIANNTHRIANKRHLIANSKGGKCTKLRKTNHLNLAQTRSKVFVLVS